MKKSCHPICCQNPKISAFTLFEILITLILLSFVILSAMSALGIVQKYWNRISKNYENELMYSQLLTMMNADFQKCRLISRSNSGLDFFMPDSTHIYYYEEPSLLIREGMSSKLDSFSLRALRVKYHFLNQEISEPDELIDDMSVRYAIDSTEYSLYAHKYYDHKTLLAFFRDKEYE